jgi:uncharacterized membrane protein YfcA
MEAVEVILVGFLAGMVSGLFGVGGGVIFVPALVFIFGLSQAEAAATSLLAIVPVAIVGSWRQNKYGNVAMKDGAIIGLLALPGAIAAAWVANAIPESVLEGLFVGLALYVAFRMGRRALTPPDSQPAAT